MVCGCADCIDFMASPVDQAVELHQSRASCAAVPHIAGRRWQERAGGRQAYGVRSRDGRAQPRAAWAAAGSVEGPLATDGAVGAQEARE